MRRSFIYAATGAACLVATSCAASGGGGGQGADRAGGRAYAKGATFTMMIPGDLGDFDPYHNTLIKPLFKLAYDSLVHLRPDGKIVSGLAERWNDDATTATFTLRQGITCSDGTPLTASQVAEDLEYAGAAKNQSTLYGTQVPSAPFTATGEDATRTVKIEMKQPYGFIMRTIGMAPIICGKGLKDRKLLKTGSDGTGPFVLTSVIPGQSYTFTVRKGYAWGPDGATTNSPGTPAKVVLRVVPNETTAANLLLSGELNMAPIDGEDRKRLDAQGLEKTDVAGPGLWLWLNHLGGRPDADPRVRRALVQALDLAEVTKVWTGGVGKPSTGLVPSEPKACAGDTVAGALPKHDPAAAQALLDQAGWRGGADGIRTKDGKPLTLALHYRAEARFDKPTAELLAERWRAVGVRVQLTGDTSTKLIDVLTKTSSYDVYMLNFATTLPSSVVKYMSGPVPPNGTNYAGVRNSAYNALVAKALTLTVPAACTYWNQAEHALLGQVDIVPVTNQPLRYYLKNAKAPLFNGYDSPLPSSIRVLEPK
jgi:peptide/nickel transport system substrate-binding protein